MRIDLLLYRLRFTKSRNLAQRWVGEGHMRCNGERVSSQSLHVEVGDVLTLPLSRSVRLIRLNALPERRGPAAEAQSCYSTLDPRAAIAIAGGTAGMGSRLKEGPSQP